MHKMLVVTWMDPALVMGAYASKCLAVDLGDAEGVIAVEGRPLIHLGDLLATRPEGRLSGDIPGPVHVPTTDIVDLATALARPEDQPESHQDN